jgi:hypothetical protein
MEKNEYVEITVKIPKGINDFLQAIGVKVKEYLEESIPEIFGSHLEVFNDSADVFIDVEKLIKEHRLKEIPIVKDYIFNC